MEVWLGVAEVFEEAAVDDGGLSVVGDDDCDCGVLVGVDDGAGELLGVFEVADDVSGGVELGVSDEEPPALDEPVPTSVPWRFSKKPASGSVADASERTAMTARRPRVEKSISTNGWMEIGMRK